MPLHFPDNRYPGVNTHLNSFLLQPDGGWESFHARHISDIVTTIDKLLPPNYYATTEKSLQISEIGLDAIFQRRTRPDVSLYQTSPTQQPSPSVEVAPTLSLPLEEIYTDEDDYLPSAVIYEVQDGKIPGKLVTRLEVLSPANKPFNDGYRQYLTKRVETLRSGIRLVEIDYVHEHLSPIAYLPRYRDQEANATPYMITVSDPTPVEGSPKLDVYAFGIEDTVPKAVVPLLGSDHILVDFNAVYQMTFSSLRLFSMLVDYEQLPVNVDRYSPADQQRIKALMDEIARSVE
jgi:hypothetical protein